MIEFMSIPKFHQYATYQDKDNFQGPSVLNFVIQG